MASTPPNTSDRVGTPVCRMERVGRAYFVTMPSNARKLTSARMVHLAAPPSPKIAHTSTPSQATMIPGIPGITMPAIPIAISTPAMTTTAVLVSVMSTGDPPHKPSRDPHAHAGTLSKRSGTAGVGEPATRRA